MNVTPDAKWLNALKLPTQVMIGLFIASGILLLLDSKEILTFSGFGHFAKPAVIVLTVLSGSLSLTGIGAFMVDQLMKNRKRSLLSARRKLRLQENEESRAEAEKAALERLDHLSPMELRYLADCLREGSQSFFTYVHSPAVTALMGKQLVYTTGGTRVPYTLLFQAATAPLVPATASGPPSPLRYRLIGDRARHSIQGRRSSRLPSPLRYPPFVAFLRPRIVESP